MSSSDDGGSRLSKTLDEVLGSSGSSGWGDDAAVAEPEPDADWSIDDEDPTAEAGVAAGSPASVSPSTPTAGSSDDGVLDVHDIDVPDHDDDSLPAGDAGFVLPEIVQATSDADEPDEPDVPELPAVDTMRPATAEPVARQPRPAAPPMVSPTPATATPPRQVAPPLARPAGWHEHVPNVGTDPERRPSRRPRVRRVTRVLRHIDPWSTFKLALLFSLVAYVSVLTSGVLLWRVADTTGALDNVERWFTQFGWETFEFKGGEIFRNAWIIGLFGVVFATGGAVLLVTLFNLVSDIIGGIRVTVLEEEVVERTITSTRRYVVRRPGVVDAAAVDHSWSLDDGPGTEVSTRDTGAPAASTDPPATADWSIDDDPPPRPG